jgi:hypothetical protein
MASAISSRASEQAFKAQMCLRLILLAASLCLWFWLSDVLFGQMFRQLSGQQIGEAQVLPGLHAGWRCLMESFNALPFEAGHCAFWNRLTLRDSTIWLIVLLLIGVIVQVLESVCWWRAQRHQLASGTERWWLALGATDEEADLAGEEDHGDIPSDTSPADGSRSESNRVSAARHRHPEMQLCWWWAESESDVWQLVSVTRLWCSPRLIALRITPQGGRSHIVWLWPDSAPARELHQLRLWLLWPPLPHVLARQPPELETLRGKRTTLSRARGAGMG